MRGAWLRLFIVQVAVLAGACGDNIDGNRPPAATAFSLQTQEDLSVMRAVEVTDLDGDVVEILTPLPPSHGEVTVNGLAITYTPDPNFHGTDQFPLTVTDGTDEVSVTIDVEVESVNDAPFGVGESLFTDEDVEATVPLSLLLDNDSDADGDSLSITGVASPVNGTVAIAGDTATFTPTLDFNGSGSFIYTVTDGAASVDVTVTVVIAPTNDPPLAIDDAFTTPRNTAITMTAAQLVANDADRESDVLTITTCGNASQGTVVFDSTTGEAIYTPKNGFTGDATFEYTVSDGLDTATATVTITVGP
jgi:hypothetical protein